MIFSGVLRVKAYLCCFTQFTVDRSKLTVNGSVLPDTPNVRYLVALYYAHYYSSPYADLLVTHVHFIVAKTVLIAPCHRL